MKLVIDGSPFLKVINEQNNLHIPKYGGQNLVCWCLHLWSLWTAFTYCCSLSWLLIWLQSEVGDPCFIHYHIFIQKLLLMHWNSCKRCSESLMHCCFQSTVSKHSTHFEHSFLIDKSSCKMVNTLHSDTFNSSAISCNFNLWWAKMNLWSFLVFSGTAAKFGQAKSSASFLSVWPHLKSAYHLLTVVSNGTEFK